MDHQTSIRNGRGTATGRGEHAGVLGGVGSFGNNLVQLTTLQSRLFQINLADASRTAVPAMIVLITAIFTIPAGLVVAAIGLALWLVESGTLSAPVAYLTVGVSILVLMVIASVIALLMIRKSSTAFRGSVEELQRNLAWVQTVLTQSGR